MIKEEAIIFFGGNVLQYEIIKQAINIGFKTILFDKNKECYSKNIVSEFYNISAKEKELVKDIIYNKISNRYDIKFIVCNVTFCKETAYDINKFYKLVDYNIFAFNCSKDKELIYNNLYKTNLYKLLPKIFKFDHKIIYPVILKPKDGSSSKDIIYCDNEEKLYSALEHLYVKYTINDILIQEYVKGQEYRGYFFIADNKFYNLGIVKRKFDKNHIFQYAKISNLEINIQELYSLFSMIGIKKSILKIDFIFNEKNKIKILEFDFNFDDYIAPILFKEYSPYIKIFSYLKFLDKKYLNMSNCYMNNEMYSIMDNSLKKDKNVIVKYIKNFNTTKLLSNDDLYGYKYCFKDE